MAPILYVSFKKSLRDREKKNKGNCGFFSSFGKIESDRDRRSAMGRQSKTRAVVFLQKDGLVQNLFPLDGFLLKAIEKNSGARRSSSPLSKFVLALQRILGFGR
jgi:hypothetical protein